MLRKVILCALLGYLLGTINPAYILGRLRGMDIRQSGSKNAGASNALLLLGRSAAICSALFDIAKATAAYLLAPLLFEDLFLSAEIAGCCAILGHIFPFYMKFRGGKGTACLGGVLLAIDWRLLLILLAIELLVALLSDYLCMVPITAAPLTPVLYGLLGKSGFDLLLHAQGGWWGAAVLSIAMLAILFSHVKNIKRLLRGTELHLSYVWSKDKESELARIRENESRYLSKNKKD